MSRDRVRLVAVVVVVVVAVATVNKLDDRGFVVWLPGWVRYLSLLRNAQNVSLRTSYSIAPVWSFPRGWCGLDVMLTSRHHPVPSLRMSGIIRVTLDGQAGTNGPPIFYLTKNSCFGYWVEKGQIKTLRWESGKGVYEYIYIYIYIY